MPFSILHSLITLWVRTYSSNKMATGVWVATAVADVEVSVAEAEFLWSRVRPKGTKVIHR